VRPPEGVSYFTGRSMNELAIAAFRYYLESEHEAIQEIIKQARWTSSKKGTAVSEISIFTRRMPPGMVWDFELLEAAVMRPSRTVGGLDAYSTIHEKVAALTHSLIKNHPFVD
jgi:prophage maintenance system killer protein